MGGSVPIISSVIGLVGGMVNQQRKPDVPDRAAQIEAERRAQEEEQRKKEAEIRKRDREKVTEARSVEQKRVAAGNAPKTTLANGGAGLREKAAVETKQLKTRLGE